MNGPTLRQRAEAAEAEADRLRDLMDDDVSFKDLEMKMRDGSLDLSIVLGEGSRPAMKFLAAIALHVLLDEESLVPNEPPNYRHTRVEWDLKPAGQFDKITVAIEVIKPRGRSSHEIRQDYEVLLSGLVDSLPGLTTKQSRLDAAERIRGHLPADESNVA